jgi:ABC-type Na+ efflux pump permease subunit
MQRLLKSAKFWTAIIDVVISLILYFTGKYLAPTIAEDIKIVIAAIQPVFLMVIGGIAYEDGQAKRAGNGVG